MAREKITIELEDELVAAALQVARGRGISLRQLIRDGLKSIAASETANPQNGGMNDPALSHSDRSQ